MDQHIEFWLGDAGLKCIKGKTKHWTTGAVPCSGTSRSLRCVDADCRLLGMPPYFPLPLISSKECFSLCTKSQWDWFGDQQKVLYKHCCLLCFAPVAQGGIYCLILLRCSDRAKDLISLSPKAFASRRAPFWTNPSSQKANYYPKLAHKESTAEWLSHKVAVSEQNETERCVPHSHCSSVSKFLERT